MRIISANNPQEIRKIMSGIRVDKYGINIMLPKTITRLVKLEGFTNIAANILKQEMLSLGGDVAVSRSALTASAKNKTDCLLIATPSQIFNLCQKLKNQPFGLEEAGEELKEILGNFEKKDFILNLGRYKLNLGQRTYIMGIVNLTPDSFSGDGLLKISNFTVDRVEKMVKDGADIIDLGGESSRPGARAISVKEEISRTIPYIKALAKKIKVPISIDTYKPEVARQALCEGARMVNDITGLRNRKLARLIAKYKAGVVIMHMQGNPRNMQANPRYKSLVSDILEYFKKSVGTALDCGIAKDKIILDPGIGFGKTLEDNLEILRCLEEFKSLGFPLMVGTSRKSFLGKITGQGPQDRVAATIASNTLAISNGANIIRVHDVKEAKDAAKVNDAILNRRR